MIIINFPSEDEGSTWNKRKPHPIHLKKEIVNKNSNDYIPVIEKSEDKIETPISILPTPKTKQIKQNKEQVQYILNITEKVRLLVKKVQNNTEFDEKNNIIAEVKALEMNLKNHRNYFSTPEQIHQYIQCIYELIHLQYKTITPKKNNIQHSKKEIQLGEQLDELKKIIKKKRLSKDEKKSLLNKLQDMKSNIHKHLSDYTKFDNIPGRLIQIEQYMNKLKGIPNTPKKTKVIKEKIVNPIETKTKKKFKVVLRNHSLESMI